MNGIRVTLLILALLLAYVLSTGPVFWLCSDPSGRIGGISGQVFLVAYLPILWPYQNGPEPIRGGIRWYLGLFRPQL